MRPLLLDLVAFRSYERETVDWREHGLVVITGDTGAGKSSLLDAMGYALYARTAEGLGPRELLTLGREHGEVRLTFLMDGAPWRVTRRFGHGAPEPAHLLERLDAVGRTLERIAGLDEVNGRVRDLLGMGFDAFTSAVLLAQGRFSRFLGEKPGARDDILRELFGVRSLESARQAAAGARDAAGREADVLAGERDAVPLHEPARRSAAARAAGAAGGRRAALRGLLPLARDALAERERGASLAARRDEIARALGLLPPEGERRRLGDRVRELDGLVASAAADHASAEAALAEAEAALAAARRGAGGGAAELAALRAEAEAVGAVAAGLPERTAALLAEGEEIAAREADLATAGSELAALHALRDLRSARAREAAAGVALEAAAQRAATAEAAASRAREALERAWREHAAAHLRAGLAPGDPCPVCRTPVGVMDGTDPPALARAETRADRAELARGDAARDAAAREAELAAAAAAREDAERAWAASPEAPPVAGDDAAAPAAEIDRRERAAAETGPLLARRRGALESAVRELERDRERVRAGRERLGRWAETTDPSAALSVALARVEAADAGARRAAAAERTARDDLGARREERQELERTRVAGLRQAAARLAERLGARPPAPDLSAGALVAACERLESRGRAEGLASGAGAERAAARAAALAAEVVHRGGPADPAGTPAAAGSADVELAERRRALADVEDAAARARRLARREREARAEAARHAQVALDLQANRFPRYLLQRYRSRLAVGASARLQELSAGAYRFAAREPDPLAVVDLRRGERLRTAATLSGGERFLASLALALGLSDVAAESGGRLDCLFLDEGFSTLDVDSLEQAMCGIERLAGDGRLIGVITHLPGVAERLGAAIRIAKDASGASRLVRERAALAA
jgi:exonuclease SbcC